MSNEEKDLHTDPDAPPSDITDDRVGLEAPEDGWGVDGSSDGQESETEESASEDEEDAGTSEEDSE